MASQESNDAGPAKSGLAFAFTKKKESKKLNKSAVGDHADQPTEETDYVTSLEEREVQSLKPKEQKTKEYVVPLIKQNYWRSKVQASAEKKTGDKAEGDVIDNQAVKELIEEAARRNEDWQERGSDAHSDVAIPLLMQNKVPEGFETDDKLDVSLRPDGPEDADYDEITIAHFGSAMLRGMGWKEGEGIGKSKKVVSLIEATLRPKGLGLGADKQHASMQQKAGKQPLRNENDEELVLKKGACCMVNKGKHKDLYGVVEGLDEDNARVMLKMCLSNETVSLSQYAVNLVTKKEYEKYGKYLNKGKADKYKSEADKKQDRGNEEDADPLVEPPPKSSRREESRELKHESKKHSSRDSSGQSSSSSKAQNGQPQPKRMTLWVRSRIRVRIIDRDFRKGKYYKEKVVVEDVLSPDNILCRTDDGRVLEHLKQSMLETVIPRSDPSYVLILGGSCHGQLGVVMKRDKDRALAAVQLLSDRDRVLKLDYDDICEYVGEIDEEFDY